MPIITFKLYIALCISKHLKICIEISRENFRVLLKICENRESFVPWRICCLQYNIQVLHICKLIDTLHMYIYVHTYVTTIYLTVQMLHYIQNTCVGSYGCLLVLVWHLHVVRR